MQLTVPGMRPSALAKRTTLVISNKAMNGIMKITHVKNRVY